MRLFTLLPYPLSPLEKGLGIEVLNWISSWNNKMSCFILLEIWPLPLPSPNPDSYRERVIERRIDEVLLKEIGHYLFPITYILISKAFKSKTILLDKSNPAIVGIFIESLCYRLRKNNNSTHFFPFICSYFIGGCLRVPRAFRGGSEGLPRAKPHWTPCQPPLNPL